MYFIFVFPKVQYGGRVTDDLDKCLLNTFTRVWFSENTCGDKFCFYKGYTIPRAKSVSEYLQHIETLPLVDSPEVGGGWRGCLIWVRRAAFGSSSVGYIALGA